MDKNFKRMAVAAGALAIVVNFIAFNVDRHGWHMGVTAFLLCYSVAASVMLYRALKDSR